MKKFIRPVYYAAPISIKRRLDAFHMWIELGQNLSEISRNTGICLTTLRKIAAQDSWKERAQERVTLGLDQHEANAKALILQSKPIATHQNLKIEEIHGRVVEKSLRRIEKALDNGTIDPKTLTLSAISKSFKTHIDGSTKLAEDSKAKGQSLGRGNTFVNGSLCVVNAQPIRKIDPAKEKGPEPANCQPKAIDATCEEIIEEL